MSTHLAWRVSVLTLAFVGIAGASQARQIAASFDELRLIVRQGDQVTVTDTGGRQTKGRITHLSASSLALLTRNGEREVVQSEVKTITRRRHGNLGQGAIAGLLVGAALGTAAVVGGDCYCGPAFLFWSAVIMGGAGSGLGVAVSAMTWRNQVVFERPRPSAKTLTVSPMIGGDRAGARLTIGY